MILIAQHLRKMRPNCTGTSQNNFHNYINISRDFYRFRNIHGTTDPSTLTETLFRNN